MRPVALFTWMVWRVSDTWIFCSLRFSTRFTLLPTGPRIRCAATSRSMPFVLTPLMERIQSPGFRWAFAAGESSMGSTTTSWL